MSFDSPSKQSFTVPEEYHGAKLYAFLRGWCKMSGGLIRSTKFLPEGFTIEGRQVHTDYRLSAGQVVTVCCPEDKPDIKPQPIEMRLLYESDSALVFDKPAGIVVHPTLGYPDKTLANGFAYWCEQRGLRLDFRPVYRIDKDTSGCLLVAKSRYAAALLSQCASKEYTAIVSGSLAQKQGSLTGPIGNEDGSFIKYCVREGGKPCQTDYRVQREYEGYSSVIAVPVTGRTHQIRVHFAHLGHPLLGDDFYGGDRGLISRSALHCRKISFYDGGEQTVVSPMPPDMAALLNEEDF